METIGRLTDVITRATSAKIQATFSNYRVAADVESLARMLYTTYCGKVAARDRVVTPEAAKLLSSRCYRIAGWLTNPASKDSLRLMGGVGTGKTTMLKSIKDVLWSLGYIDVMFFNADQLGRQMMDNEDLFKRYICGSSCKLLLLDDVGIESVTSYKYREELMPFIEVVNRRYSHRLRMIITTNLSVTKEKDMFAEMYGERTADRLREMCNNMVFTEQSYRR